jgi:hypothetical protein
MKEREATAGIRFILASFDKLPSDEKPKSQIPSTKEISNSNIKEARAFFGWTLVLELPWVWSQGFGGWD